MRITGKAMLIGIELLILSLFPASRSSGTEKPHLPFATGEYAPYTSSKMEGHGLMAEIVSAAVKEMGYCPEYGFFPWRRCEHLTRSGTVWAAFPYGHTEERAEDFLFSDELLETSTVFFYSKKIHAEAIRWETLDDLKPYSIVGILGYYYEEEFREAGLNVEYTKTEKSALNMLYHGRVDLFPADDAVGWELIKTYFPDRLDQFGTLNKPHETSGNYLLISKTCPHSEQLLSQFNAALARIKKQGIVEQLTRKYTQETDH